MPKIPKPRNEGHFGGRGGHGKNMHNAQKRDNARMPGKFPKLLLFVIILAVVLILLGFFIL